MTDTPKDKKSDELNPSEAKYQNMVDQPLGKNESKQLKDAESKSESSAPDSSFLNSGSPESSYYKHMVDKKSGGYGSRIVSSFKNASNFKKGAAIGGVAGIALLIGAFFFLLSTFQLLQFAEMFDSVFDAQTKRVLNSRAAKHYRILLDEDGSSYYKKTGFRGKLGKAFSSIDPATIRADLKERVGLDVDVDPSTGRFRINGEPVDGKLSEQRNRLRTELDKAYQNDGFLKRSVRSRTAFKAMGIQRTFFENTRRAVTDWELDMIKKMRTRLGLSAGDARISVNDSRNPDGPTEIDSEGTAELRQNLADPSYDPGDSRTVVPDPDINAGKVLGGTITATGLVDGACEIKYLLKGTELMAKIIRHRALIVNAGAILVAAHQIKTGDQVSAAEISALMGIINRAPGIGASGSYQLMNGRANAVVNHTDTLSLDFTKVGGVGGVIANANQTADDILDKVPAGQSYCKLSRNVFYQIGSGVVGVAIAIGGTATGAGTVGILAKAGAQAALWTMVSALGSYLSAIIANDIAGPAAILHYGPSQGGDKSFDALAGGVLGQSSADRYHNGMTQYMSQEEVTTLESKIALEKAEEAKNQSVFTKYLALSNPDSMLTRQLIGAPSNPETTARIASNSVASLPAKFAKSLSLFTPQGKANAEDSIAISNPYLSQNPLGIPMFGMSDETVNEINTKYDDPVQNEEYIYDSEKGIDGYFEWRSKCYPQDDPAMLYGLPSNEDQEDVLNECTFGTYQATTTSYSEDGGSTTVAGISTQQRDMYLRYATYHLDRTLLQGSGFNSEITDCTNPDSEDFYCKEDSIAGTDQDVNLVSWNVAFFKTNATDIENALGQFQANNIDIIGMQEVSNSGKDEKVQELTNCDSCYYDSFPRVPPGEGGNIPILWKDDRFVLETSNTISVHGQEKVEDGAGGSQTTNKKINYVRLRDKITRKSFYVANAHALPTVESGGRPNDNTRRLELYDLMMDKFDGFFSGKSEPIFVTGDFNVDWRKDFQPQNQKDPFPYRRFTINNNIRANWDWARTSGSLPDGGTKDNRLIDYVFAKDHELVNFVSTDIWETFGSDHNAARATYRIISPVASGGEATEGGWTWPVSDADFKPINPGRCFDPAPPGTGHTGADIPVTNVPVYAMNSGKVLQAQSGGDAGNYVLIDHRNGYFSHYQHLTSYVVKPGDEVRSGQKIGISGNTGFSTGPHLHFGISTTASLNSRTNTGSAVEPTKFLPPREGNPCI